MIHKLLPILIGLLICLCPKPVFASSAGSLEIQLPEDMEGQILCLAKEGEDMQSITVGKNGIVKIEDLLEGTYRIEIPETSEYIFENATVSIPTWDEVEKKMLYNVTVIPKYVQKEKPVIHEENTSPDTGDASGGNVYTGSLLVSLIFLVIMSCHNRLSCATMTDKYSKNGGQSNGNDNDAKNPCCTRRIGLSSPRSIN